MTKIIPLTKNKECIVDDSDYENLIKYKWHICAGYASRVEYYYNKGDDKILKNRKSRRIYMHRQIMGEDSKLFVDHKNRNKLDNTRNNLRLCSRRQNAANSKFQKRKTGVSYKGVYLRKNREKKWCSYIQREDGKSKFIGCFFSEKDAAKAYNEKAVELFGEFAKLNEV